jgi:hypothetical protein
VVTLNEIKEHMSRNQFKTIANRCGYKCERPGDGDHGVDFRVDEVQVIQMPNGPRLLDTGRTLQFQLKATTAHNVDFQEATFKFDLEAKTYNDLVYRLQSNYPLTLIVAILPDSESDWVRCSHQELNQVTQLYWYRPQPNTAITENIATKRIEISMDQRVDLEFLGSQFEEMFA